MTKILNSADFWCHIQGVTVIEVDKMVAYQEELFLKVMAVYEKIQKTSSYKKNLEKS